MLPFFIFIFFLWGDHDPMTTMGDYGERVVGEVDVTSIPRKIHKNYS